MNVAVVIIGYRNAHEIRKCLELLLKSSHRDFSVHVCENGGSKAFTDLLAEISPIVFEFTEVAPRSRMAARMKAILPSGQSLNFYDAGANLGYAGGINVCLEAIAADARYEAVWILNPDTEPHEGALASMIAHQKKKVDTGLLVAGLFLRKAAVSSFMEDAGGAGWPAASTLDWVHQRPISRMWRE